MYGTTVHPARSCLATSSPHHRHTLYPNSARFAGWISSPHIMQQVISFLPLSYLVHSCNIGQTYKYHSTTQSLTYRFHRCCHPSAAVSLRSGVLVLSSPVYGVHPFSTIPILLANLVSFLYRSTFDFVSTAHGLFPMCCVCLRFLPYGMLVCFPLPLNHRTASIVVLLLHNSVLFRTPTQRQLTRSIMNTTKLRLRASSG